MWRCSKAGESKYAAYRELCQARDVDVSASLLDDLRICAEDDVDLLCAMACDVFYRFAEESRNNSSILHLYVSHIDGRQLYQLLVQVLHGSLVLFNRAEPTELIEALTASLEWETFEQMALWQLVAAHSLPLSLLLPLLPKLKEDRHCEALTALLTMIKHERPSNDLLKCLLACPIGSFVSALLSHWSSESSNALAQVLANQFNTALNGTMGGLGVVGGASGGGSSSAMSVGTSGTSPGKRKRTTMNSLSAATGFKSAPAPGSGIDPPVELMMTHMETLRTCLTANLLTKSNSLISFHGFIYTSSIYMLCIYFLTDGSVDGSKHQPAEIKVFAHESMQGALQQVQQVCNDSQKKRFSDLFSLLDTNDEPPESVSGSGNSNTNSRRRGGAAADRSSANTASNKRTAGRSAATNNSGGRNKQTNKDESEEESSEEEVILKQRATKKRRKAAVVGSDSD